MSRDGSIELTWGDGAHTFRLAWGELIKLQESRDAGPFALHQRLADGSWRVEDIVEVIRWGLIGGGMTPADAVKKIRLFVEGRPPLENLIYAQTILGVALTGAPDEQLKKKPEASPTGSMTSPTAKSE